MVAFAVLTPEQRDLIMRGRLAETTYRPFPGARVDYEEPRDDESWQEFKERQDPRTPNRRIDLDSAARHWKESTREIGLLVARDVDGQYNIIAIGEMIGRKRTRQPGVRRIEVNALAVLDTPIDLASISASLERRDQRRLSDEIAGIARPFSPRLGAVLWEKLTHDHSYLIALRNEAQERWNAEARSRLARSSRGAQLPRAAAASALRMFSSHWHELDARPNPNLSPLAEEFEESMRVFEDDVISDDSVVFPEWERSAQSQLGWWEFRDGDRRLLIKNINVSTPEAKTGADLVYAKRNPDSFILVQYKMLKVEAKTGQRIFIPDDRLPAQLEKLLALEAKTSWAQVPKSEADYRVGPGFTFVKFVDEEGSRERALDKLSSGMYLPARFAKLVLASPDNGPKGGKRYLISDRRYLDSETFVKLVRDDWIGSLGNSTVSLSEILGFVSNHSEGSLVVAIEESIHEVDVDLN